MFVTDIANAEKVMAEHCKVFDKIRPAATLVVVSGGGSATESHSCITG